MTYDLKGTLKERIVSIKFMMSLIEEKRVIIYNTQLTLNPSVKEIKALGINRLEKQIEYLCDVQWILDQLGVEEELDCDNLSEKDEYFFRMLIMAFKCKQTISCSDMILPLIGYVRISNLYILLRFTEQCDGKYKLEDFNDYKTECCSDYPDGTMYKTSKYTILTENHFNIISNLNYKAIVDDIIRYENKGNYERTNNLLLQMLKSYDRKKCKEVLNTATVLAQWLLQKGFVYKIAILNLYQCYYRQRGLTKDEENKLFDILEYHKDNNAILAGGYILIGEEKLANRYLDKMTPIEKKEFEEFPIYNLLERK